ncbi:MAG: FtsQ-type POTRA domain-containing protein [Verrucomicrobia bacterium]|nr:FtsQ-type POTRA domain-containing protein [Verrucomicrobiota bacterium]
MWFRRKIDNRRFRREHVLDVKMRSDQARTARVGLAARVLTILFGALLVLFLFWRGGGWLLDELVYTNDAFALKEISVQTDGIIAPEQVRKWSGVKPGDNLFALDLPRLKRDLELVPAIQSVAVERVLPNTLRLRVTEREPVAQIVALRARIPAGGYERAVYQVDATGRVMLPLERHQTTDGAGQHDDSLPVLTGVNSAELQPGRKLESPQAVAALQLIREFDGSAMSGSVDLRRIEVSTPEILKVAVSNGGEVTFSIHHLDQQMRRWRAVSDAGRSLGKPIAALDLSVTNNIPVSWAAAGSHAPSAPKSVKPSRYRKKNV